MRPNTQNLRKQTISQAEIKHHGFFATALGALLLFFALAAPAFAVDSIWDTIASDGNWNNGGNWNTGMPPVMAGDTATFNTSNMRFLSLSADVTIDSMTFNSGASAFTISVGGDGTPFFTFTINGGSITNNSGMTQNFATTGVGAIIFTSGATAGNNVTITNGNPLFPDQPGGSTTFQGTSSADNATITNNGSFITNTLGGSTTFQGSSSAANATITNNGGGNGGEGTGSTTFQDSSTAGNATGNATITNNGGAFSGEFGGSTTFQGTSSAVDATITNNGSPVSGAGGGRTTFQDTSHAGNATLIANGGSGGGF